MLSFDAPEAQRVYEHIQSLSPALIALEESDFARHTGANSYAATVKLPVAEPAGLAGLAVEQAMGGRSTAELRFATAMVYGDSEALSMLVVNEVMTSLQDALPEQVGICFGVHLSEDLPGEIGLDLLLS